MASIAVHAKLREAFAPFRQPREPKCFILFEPSASHIEVGVSRVELVQHQIVHSVETHSESGDQFNDFWSQTLQIPTHVFVKGHITCSRTAISFGPCVWIVFREPRLGTSCHSMPLCSQGFSSFKSFKSFYSMSATMSLMSCH